MGRIGRVARWGLSLVCLAWAFRGVPLAALWDVLRGFPVLPMIATVAVTFVSYAVAALRLSRMAQPPLPLRSTFLATLAGLAINNVVPAKAGELAKAAWLARSSHTSVGPCLGLVIMERFFDVNVLALLGLWTLWGTHERVAAGLLACLVAGWAVLIALRRWPGLVARLPSEGILGSLGRALIASVDQTGPGRLVWLGVSSLALWIVYTVQMGVALIGAAGLELGPMGVLRALTASGLGMLLPSSPGALGVYEAAMMSALASSGVPRDQALAAALFAHMAQFVPVTLAGGAAILALPAISREGIDH